MSIKFLLGQIVATPGALDALEESHQKPGEFLKRHAAGDWGEVSSDDARLNNESLQDGSRILSAYTTATGTRIWIITEAADDDGLRTATTILLPEEY